MHELIINQYYITSFLWFSDKRYRALKAFDFTNNSLARHQDEVPDTATAF